jgi:hypothetical protein
MSLNEKAIPQGIRLCFLLLSSKFYDFNEYLDRFFHLIDRCKFHTTMELVATGSNVWTKQPFIG